MFFININNWPWSTLPCKQPAIHPAVSSVLKIGSQWKYVLRTVLISKHPPSDDDWLLHSTMVRNPNFLTKHFLWFTAGYQSHSSFRFTCCLTQHHITEVSHLLCDLKCAKFKQITGWSVKFPRTKLRHLEEYHSTKTANQLSKRTWPINRAGNQFMPIRHLNWNLRPWNWWFR